MNRVLITGANGFIGSKTFECFKTNGYEVYGWDKNGRSNVEMVDLSVFDQVMQNLERINPDIIIHCAGSADVAKSVSNPKTDFEGNVIATHNLLFALHKINRISTKVVFLSSASVYGNPKRLPINETEALLPLSPYAVHKVMCEDLCEYFVRNYKMNIKIARIFSAYGAGLKKQIFWDMHQKVEKTGKLEMLGTGNESRDYIHVNDVINALYLIATMDSNEMVFNVANGEEITIHQVTSVYAKILSIDERNISFNGVVREGDPLNWRADISRLKELGYHKTISLEKGLEDYVKWVKSI